MNRIKTKIHDTTDRIKGLRGTENKPLEIWRFLLLAFILGQHRTINAPLP